MHFNVRVPASSANLGSGFDTLAVALNLFTDLEVDSAADGIEITGGPDLCGGDNLILRGIELVAEATGRRNPALSHSGDVRHSGRPRIGKLGHGAGERTGCV